MNEKKKTQANELLMISQWSINTIEIDCILFSSVLVALIYVDFIRDAAANENEAK